MTVVMLPKTQEQSDLLALFADCLNRTQQNIEELAHAYKACVDAGIDMSRYGASLGARLMRIAEGKLLPTAAPKLLALPDATIAALSSLAKVEQKRLWDEGAEIWRDNRAQKVPLEGVRAAEARRLIDATGGRARLLTPEEQAARQAPAIPRHDKLVELRFTPDEYEAVSRKAHKEQQSVAHYIKRQLYMAGVLGKLKQRA